MKRPAGWNSFRHYLPLLICLALATSLRPFGTPVLAKQPSVEIRATWLILDGHFSEDPARGRAEVQACINRLADAHFNAVFIWMRSEYAAAIQDERFRPLAPLATWDAVEEAMSAASKCGLQTHLWYSFTHYKSAQSPEFNRGAGGDPTWASMSVEELGSEVRSMADCCPMHPAARKWELDLIQRMISRYPKLAGVHIEEPGYGYADRCVCDLCRTVYQQTYQASLEAEPTGERAADLKCLATTAFMRDLDQWRRQQGRSLSLSTNGGADWRGERKLGRDWARWARLGWLDFYAAQIYTTDEGEFSRLAAEVMKELQGDCPILIGVAAKWSNGENDAASIAKQIERARRAGAQGVAIYHAAALSDKHLAALAAGPFRDAASLQPQP